MNNKDSAADWRLTKSASDTLPGDFKPDEDLELMAETLARIYVLLINWPDPDARGQAQEEETAR